MVSPTKHIIASPPVARVLLLIAGGLSVAPRSLCTASQPVHGVADLRPHRGDYGDLAHLGADHERFYGGDGRSFGAGYSARAAHGGGFGRLDKQRGYHGTFVRNRGYGYEKRYGFDRIYANDHGYDAEGGAHGRHHHHHVGHGILAHHGAKRGAHYHGNDRQHHHGFLDHGNHHRHAGYNQLHGDHYYGVGGFPHLGYAVDTPHLDYGFPVYAYPVPDVHQFNGELSPLGHASLYGHMGLGGYNY